MRLNLSIFIVGVMINMANARTIPVYFGTYSEGIYRSVFDDENGKLSNPVLAGRLNGASYFVIDSERSFLYSVSESGPSSEIAAFKIEDDMSLRLINKLPSGGSSACYLSFDKTERYLFAANYSSGTVAVFSIAKDHSLKEMTCLVQHETGKDEAGNAVSPRAHSMIPDIYNKHLFSADLGLDRIMIYDFDIESGQIKSASQPFLQLEKGSGPRHLVFNDTGEVLYCINELASTIAVLAYFPENSSKMLAPAQTISTLPTDYEGRNACAEVLISPCKKYLYASNRGHDTIAAFRINPDDGKLSFLDCCTGDIDFPRGFRLDPSGKFCLVANQKGDSVVVFAIDQKVGLLKRTEHRIAIAKPVFVKFLDKY
ncbi:MAG: lactonase family protein [Sedimentisphaeraceae bacterium JB056]